MLEERNRELHRELIDAKRSVVRVVELEGKVAQLEDQLADKDGELEVEIQRVIEEIETERDDEVKMVDRVVYEATEFFDPYWIAEKLYHEITTANGTHTSWAAAPPRTRSVLVDVCERLFRDVRRAVRDYDQGILRTPEQLGS